MKRENMLKRHIEQDIENKEQGRGRYAKEEGKTAKR